ncbi:hypothetical protein Moror_7624 [Moniliophthora roreri MCA 2997]|uniref:Uncharacterized protein n=1 Tax=Moniliophthora roreri (strain MCA 2997) TaxID=1381753 RepID=V2W2E2_MONRO|nr:hypothetical protein Moror_7624 [Moniliophthora roreri MCA 2997]
MTERLPIKEEDYLDDDNGELIKFQMGDGILEEPYPFENFKDEIDNCGGYLFELAKCVEDFEDELHEAWLEVKADEEIRENVLKSRGIERVDTFVQLKVFPPRLTEEWSDDHPYKEKHRSDFAKNLDNHLEDLKKWLADEDWRESASLEHSDRKFLEKQSPKFFVDRDGRLYRRNENLEGQHRLVIPKEKRMWMRHSVGKVP